jgi:signal transduction histidine kinase
MLLRPFWRLWLPVGSALLAIALAIFYMHSQPWMGLALENKDGKFYGQAGVLLAINGQSLHAHDLLEDPGMIEADADFHAFLQRQDAFALALRQPSVQLTWQSPSGQISTRSQAVQSSRPLHTLPLAFWVQCAVALTCMLIGGWVWALLPQDPAARLFALTGLCVLLFALSAACYSSRAIALPGADFLRLAALNRFGATAYGFVGMAFFLRYPLPLIGRRWLWLLFAAQMLVFVSTSWGWLPQFATAAVTGLQMLAMLALMLLQAWRCRRRPVERAALTWLGLSVALGAGAFVSVQVVPAVLGYAPLASQAWSFVFFVLPYAGIALGLTRYRLFDVGDWAFRLLFLMLGAVLLLLLDVALISLLNWSSSLALGAALLLVGFAYLPLRDWLQRKLLRRAELPRSELFARAMGVAFAPDALQRQARWEDLLGKLFQPLQINLVRGEQEVPKNGVKVAQSGLSMDLPAVADLQALRLSQAQDGRSLFGPQQVQLAERLLDLLQQAHSSRLAYDQGVQAERLRVAQDLHDDIGARLLTAIHRSDAHADLRPILQETLNDVRSIAQGLAETGASLDVLLPELRHETMQRCEAAGVLLDWPPEQTAQLLAHCPCPEGGAQLDYRARRLLLSVVREGVSNSLKHAGASRLALRYQFLPQQQALQLDVSDNGCGFAAERLDGQGMGIDNLRMRAQRIGAQIFWQNTEDEQGCSGSLLRLQLPVAAMRAAAPAAMNSPSKTLTPD